MTSCTICLDPIIEEKNYLVTDCKHVFHFSCIIKNIDCNFYSKGLNCPICRTSLLPDRVLPTTIIPRVHMVNLPVPRLQAPRLVVTRSPVPVVIRPMQNIHRFQNMRQYRSFGPQNTSRRAVVLKKIDKLTYSQLKNELKKRNISTRGYKRETFEKRLLENIL